tara:strand:+ start:923 stop:1303 length:381 start_codon:yes stop_codon:yes gene_type:complete
MNIQGSQIISINKPQIPYFMKHYEKKINRPWFGEFSERNFLNSNIPLSTLPDHFKLVQRDNDYYEIDQDDHYHLDGCIDEKIKINQNNNIEEEIKQEQKKINQKQNIKLSNTMICIIIFFIFFIII